MGDDVLQLLGEEAHVQGVQHRSHARHGQVGFHVLLVIEAERRHPVPVADPEGCKSGGEALGVFGHLCEARPSVARALEGHDLAVAVHLFAVPQDLAHEERCVLHRAAHCGLLGGRPGLAQA